MERRRAVACWRATIHPEDVDIHGINLIFFYSPYARTPPALLYFESAQDDWAPVPRHENLDSTVPDYTDQSSPVLQPGRLDPSSAAPHFVPVPYN